MRSINLIRIKLIARVRVPSILTWPPSLPNLSLLDPKQQFFCAMLSKLRVIVGFQFTKVGYVLRAAIVTLPRLLCLCGLALCSFPLFCPCPQPCSLLTCATTQWSWFDFAEVLFRTLTGRFWEFWICGCAGIQMQSGTPGKWRFILSRS